MQHTPYPRALLIVLRNTKLLILLGPCRSKLQFRLPTSSFFYTKAEQLSFTCTALPRVLFILFMKMCGHARLITFMPYLLLKLNSLFQIQAKFSDPSTNTPPSVFSFIVLNFNMGLHNNPRLDFKCTPKYWLFDMLFFKIDAELFFISIPVTQSLI